MDSLVSSAMCPQKQAVALETVIACQELPWHSSFFLGVARCMLGCSARFNDFQHCRPSDVHLTTNTIEVMAWQTKTSSLQGGKRKPSPLIAPQWCFASFPEPWWETVLQMFQRFSVHPAFQEMDCLIPTVSGGAHGVIPRPSSYSRALRWLKVALYSVAPIEEISKLTWHSMSVYARLCLSGANTKRPTSISWQLD